MNNSIKYLLFSGLVALIFSACTKEYEVQFYGGEDEIGTNPEVVNFKVLAIINGKGYLFSDNMLRMRPLPENPDVFGSTTMRAARFNADGSRIALRYEDGNIRVIDAKTYELIEEIPNTASNNVKMFTFHPNGETICALGTNNKILQYGPAVILTAGQTSMLPLLPASSSIYEIAINNQGEVYVLHYNYYNDYAVKKIGLTTASSFLAIFNDNRDYFNMNLAEDNTTLTFTATGSTGSISSFSAFLQGNSTQLNIFSNVIRHRYIAKGASEWTATGYGTIYLGTQTGLEKYFELPLPPTYPVTSIDTY